MKKHLSLLLAVLFVMASFTFVLPASAAANPIRLEAPTFNWQMDTNRGATHVAAERDGINVVRYTPNPDSGDYIVTDGHVSGMNIMTANYKYIGIDYYYEISEADASSEFAAKQMDIWFLGSTATKNPLLYTGTLENNKWARAIIDISSLETDKVYSDGKIGQFHFHPWSDTGKIMGNNAVGVMDINNITFYAEYPGTPTVSGVEFAKNSVSIEKGSSLGMPTVTVTGENSPIQTVDIEMKGHASEYTKLEDGVIVVGENETASSFTLTATSVVDATKTATLIVNVISPAPATPFDEDNVILRFGIASDIHLSGSWNQTRSKAKWAHTINAFEKMAQDDGGTLDALLAAGDLVDAVNSPGNVNGYNGSGNFNSNGSPAVQNFREINFWAQGLWGGTNPASTSNTAAKGAANYNDPTTGYGNGLDDSVRFFYSLGNHDESGMGVAGSAVHSDKSTYSLKSAYLYASILCGWQFDISDNSSTREFDLSFEEYIVDLIKIHNNEADALGEAAFEEKYDGKCISYADATSKFEKYFGYDTNFSATDGLLVGNRHMTIGEDNDRIHFAAIEISQSATSLAFLKSILDTSVEENPAKPVFIIMHYKTDSNVVGFEGYTNKVAWNELLKNYPQAIVWSGHSHSDLHSDLAINTSLGYTAIDAGVVAYHSPGHYTLWDHATQNSTTKTILNFASHDNHYASTGCYVQMDKNFNVRVNRVDLYRSYSADYAENPTLYATDAMSDFTNTSKVYELRAHSSHAKEQPYNRAVFIREPWDLTDFDRALPVKAYTPARAAKSTAPSVKADVTPITLTPGILAIKADFNLDLTAGDNIVYYHKLQLMKGDSVVDTKYLTTHAYNYEDGIVPAVDYSYNYTGLDDDTEYTLKVTPYNDLGKAGEPITATVSTPESGAASITLPDGRTGYFVDTSDSPSSFHLHTDGEKYTVLTTFKSAIDAGADVIYFIKGDAELYGIQTKKAIEIIGIERDNCVINYGNGDNNHSRVFAHDVTFNNLSIRKDTTGDTALMPDGHKIVFHNCKTTGNTVNIFGGKYGTSNGANIVISGNEGDPNAFKATIYPGAVTDGRTQNGNVTVTVSGGYIGTLGVFKNGSGAEGAYAINGNVFVNISGGKVDKVTPSTTSKDTPIRKNLIVTITGGEILEVGRSGDTQVDGKEIFIINEGTFSKIKYNSANDSILVKIPDNEGGIGDITYDESGYATRLAIKQVTGKSSRVSVNGAAAVKAETIELTKGATYVVSYSDAENCIIFHANGGTGEVPAILEGTPGTSKTAAELSALSHTLTKPGYEFVGWSVNSSATEADASIEITEAGTIAYAVWKPEITEPFITLEDGRKGYFVDTSANPDTSYKFTNGVKYDVLTTFKAAHDAGADVIYYVKGDTLFGTVRAGHKKAVEIIGLDRDAAIITYYKDGDNSQVFGADMKLNNVSLHKNQSGDGALMPSGHTITFHDIKTTGYNHNIFNCGWGSGTSGKVVISGDTENGKFGFINFVNNSGANTTMTGDFNVEISGGTVALIGEYKGAANTKLNGNVFINITGGDFTASQIPVSCTTTDNRQITKNAITRITGGTFSAETTIGHTGATNVQMKEIFIIEKGILETVGANVNMPDGAILVKLPDDIGGIGKVTYDANGEASALEILQVEGKTSYVNGSAATSISLTDGTTYDVTYEGAPEASVSFEGKVYLEREAGVAPKSGNYLTLYVYDAANDELIKSVVMENADTETKSDSKGSYIEVAVTFTASDFGESESIYMVFGKNGYAPLKSDTIPVATFLTAELMPVEGKLVGGDIKSSTDAPYGDGKVDINDFINVIRAFDKTAAEILKNAADIDESGYVGVEDLGFVKNNFGYGAN